MRTSGRPRVAIGLTGLVLAAYAVECAIYYGRYLNGSFQLLPPGRAFAIEDVLGFGFWLTWLSFGVAFAATATYWWKIKAKPLHLLYWVVGLFVLISVIDFMLFRTLERQLLSM